MQIGAFSGPVYDGAMVFNRHGCLYCHTIDWSRREEGPQLGLDCEPTYPRSNDPPHIEQRLQHAGILRYPFIN